MSTLAERLAALPEAEHDQALLDVWKGFSGTEAHQALCALLDRLRDQVRAKLLGEGSTEDSRAWAAGVTFAVESLAVTILALVTPQAFEQAPAQGAPGEPDFVSKEDPAY